MNHVNYIEKTREFYARKGYDNPYRYAHFEDGPFTPMKKPVAQSRLILISSAGFDLNPDDGPEPVPFKGINIGEKNKVEVFPIPHDVPKEKLKYLTGAHDRAESDMVDFDAFFPVTRLNELRAAGEIASLAQNYLRIRPCYSQRKTMELDAPEVLRHCRAEGVEVALFAPI